MAKSNSNVAVLDQSSEIETTETTPARVMSESEAKANAQAKIVAEITARHGGDAEWFIGKELDTFSDDDINDLFLLKKSGGHAQSCYDQLLKWKLENEIDALAMSDDPNDKITKLVVKQIFSSANKDLSKGENFRGAKAKGTTTDLAEQMAGYIGENLAERLQTITENATKAIKSVLVVTSSAVGKGNSNTRDLCKTVLDLRIGTKATEIRSARQTIHENRVGKVYNK